MFRYRNAGYYLSVTFGSERSYELRFGEIKTKDISHLIEINVAS